MIVLKTLDTRKAVGLYSAVSALGDLTGSSIGGITAQIVTSYLGGTTTSTPVL